MNLEEKLSPIMRRFAGLYGKAFSVAGIPIRVDPAVPRGCVELQQNGRIVAAIVNLKEPE